MREERPLADAEFLRRWGSGELSADDERRFLAQFRHFEAVLPMFLEKILSDSSVVGRCRSSVERNLRDERGESPESSHLAMLDRCLEAVGADRAADATPAMSALLSACAESVHRSPGDGVAVLLAYEMQSPDVARAIADGLVRRGCSRAAVEFWEWHASLDVQHEAELIEAVAELAHDDAELDLLVEAAAVVRDAWITFLDEQLDLVAA